MPKRGLDFKFEDIGYNRVSPPNYERLAQFTKIAMGRRNMSEFASDSGLSIATISRVLGQKFTTPIADGIIKAIADAAEPGSIPLAGFAEAHGLEKDVDILTVDSVDALYFEGEVPRVVSDAIIKKGFTSELKSNRVEKLFSSGFFDFEIKTNALSDLGINLWCFDTLHMNGNLDRQKLLAKFNFLLASAYLNNFYANGIKISLITDTEECLNVAKEKFENLAIVDMISIIYIDPINWEIVNEYQLPMKEGGLHKKVF